MADNDVSFPLSDLNDAAEHLRRPFAPSVIRFKVQATWPKDDPRNGLIVSYVDARTISERLNYVVGGGWSTEFAQWGDDTNLAVCHLTVLGITRSDIGKGSSMEKEKAAFSDALKRAAIHFGPGAFLYKLAAVTLGASERGELDSNGQPTLLIKSRGSKTTLALTPQAEKWLREQYERWVGSDRNQFGAVLDHGDEEGAIGDPVEREPVQELDLELAAKREEVERLYDEKIAKGNGTKSKFPKGQFTAQLRQADSPDKLTEIVKKIEKAAA